MLVTVLIAVICSSLLGYDEADDVQYVCGCAWDEGFEVNVKVGCSSCVGNEVVYAYENGGSCG